jgi:hypothetical protein
MMKTYKPITTALLLVLASLGIQAQTIYYSYDNAGNRTKRSLTVTAVTSKSAKMVADTVAVADNIKTEEETLPDNSERSFKIYPNPTHGQMALAIEGTLPQQAGRIMLYSSLGALLQSGTTQGSYTPIDLSRYPAGQYILILIIDGKKYNWNIVKD